MPTGTPFLSAKVSEGTARAKDVRAPKFLVERQKLYGEMQALAQIERNPVKDGFFSNAKERADVAAENHLMEFLNPQDPRDRDLVDQLGNSTEQLSELRKLIRKMKGARSMRLYEKG